MFHFNRRKTLPASPEIEICAPCDGMLFPLESSADAVFAAKTLGEGFFIQPSDTLIYAPLSGTISALFPTKHAIGIQSEEGIEGAASHRHRYRLCERLADRVRCANP